MSALFGVWARMWLLRDHCMGWDQNEPERALDGDVPMLHYCIVIYAHYMNMTCILLSCCIISINWNLLLRKVCACQHPVLVSPAIVWVTSDDCVQCYAWPRFTLSTCPSVSSSYRTASAQLYTPPESYATRRRSSASGQDHCSVLLLPGAPCR